MRSGLFLIAAGLLILGVGIGIGVERHWLDRSTQDGVGLPEGETALGHAIKHLDPDYVCPMHPEVVSNEAGSCPICGMDLVQKQAEPMTGGAEEGLPEVVVSPEFVHNFGVRTAKVTRGPVARRIQAIGRVARMPQPRVTDVAPGLAGTLVAVTDKAVGDAVAKGELLYEVNAPEWLRLQRRYLDARGGESEATGLDQLRKRLQTLGLDAAGLKRLEETGRVEQRLKVVAPQNGYLVEITAKPGDRVATGSKVVSLGGMNRIPVTVSLFEGQGAWIRRGQPATVRVPSLPGTEFKGQVDRSDREINFSTRTLPVYLGFSTPDPRIRYGMLVDVTIEAAARQDVLRIPSDALIRTGETNRVILARGQGGFQPVEVVPGLESGELVEIVSGIEEGQEVVISGQFLIDSESSLRAGFRRMGGANDDL